MPSKFKPRKSKPPLPELCSAVLKLREGSGWSQEEIARRVGIASMTWSRYERGAMVPSSYSVLNRLARLAENLKLLDEQELFERAAEKVRPSVEEIIEQMNPFRKSEAARSQPHSPHEWRLAQVARLCTRFFPEEARAIEKAAPTAVALVDEVLARGGRADYQELEQRLDALADERARESFHRSK